MSKPNLGITSYDSFHFVVENIDRSHRFYTEKLDFIEVARPGAALSKRSGQESRVFGAGDVRVCVSTPLSNDSKAAFISGSSFGYCSRAFGSRSSRPQVRSSCGALPSEKSMMEERKAAVAW